MIHYTIIGYRWKFSTIFTLLFLLVVLFLFNCLEDIFRALGNNAIYCDCHAAWFSKWIKNRFIEAGIARCEMPLSVRNQLLLTANENQFKYLICLSKIFIAKNFLFGSSLNGSSLNSTTKPIFTF